jgi:hypothetical protein
LKHASRKSASNIRSNLTLLNRGIRPSRQESQLLVRFSLRSLLITTMAIGSLPALYANMVVPFALILVTTIIMASREFARDINADPPNFS